MSYKNLIMFAAVFIPFLLSFCSAADTELFAVLNEKIYKTKNNFAHNFLYINFLLFVHL
jgi:hypothetical protein